MILNLNNTDIYTGFSKIATLHASSNASLFQFSNPQVNDETYTGPAMPLGTVIRVTPTESSVYFDSVLFSYERIDIDGLLAAVRKTVMLDTDMTTIHAALPAFLTDYGLNFPVEDFDDGAITGESFVLKAASTSRFYKGQCVVQVKAAPTPISEIVEVTQLDGLNYPHNDPSKGYAETYSYPVDFSASYQDMVLFAPAKDNTLLAKILKDRTGDDWVNVTGSSAPFNTDGSVTTYQGLNTPELNYNPDYKYVAVVTLGDNCSNLKGKLIIHYNNPADTVFDPSVV